MYIHHATQLLFYIIIYTLKCGYSTLVSFFLIYSPAASPIYIYYRRIFQVVYDHVFI
jgi:hypothetical protein